LIPQASDEGRWQDIGPFSVGISAPQPVSGQIKHFRGLRQFLLRGLNEVRGERAMVCTAHNLTKLHHATA
jgi:hypothetical protein